MSRRIEKAYEMSNARIGFVSLVDKAANRKEFLITKAQNGKANFATYGRILKADSESHYVTGIVYEPMVEDTDGNFMTEAEITKAAHWFMKNGGDVDLQHCFEKCDGAAVVESYVAKSDMEIEGETIKKGTWLMTMEITDDDVWDSIQKGDITGFSMGGVGAYSVVDVELPVEKSEEPENLFLQLAKSLGFGGLIKKGEVKTKFNRRVKNDNFYSAWYALKDTLEGNFYDPDTGYWNWDYTDDEEKIRDALSDFNEIVTELLTKEGGIVKSLEKAAKEAEIQKEDTEMKKEEMQQVVSAEVAKAMEPITQQLEAITKSLTGGEGADGSVGEVTEEPEGAVTAESIAKMVGEEVAKAFKPVMATLEPVMKARALPGNLNDAAGEQIEKSEQHYMAGMF